MKKNRNLNEMCTDCTNESCQGTTDKVWTGCVFKDKNYTLVYDPQTKKVTIVGRR